MDNHRGDFWKSSERSIQDAFPFLSLSSNENQQNGHQQNNNIVAEQADGAGDALDGSMEIDQLQLQALTQYPGAMPYGDQYPEFGSPMTFHQNDPQYEINQAQGEPCNTINFLDRDVPPQGQSRNEGMPFINLSGALNRGVSQSVGVTASFLSPEAYNQVHFSNPMPMNTQNDGNEPRSFYSLALNRDIHIGGPAYGRSMARESQTWEDPQLRNMLAQHPAANSRHRGPIPNSLYDPRYEQLGLPVDPHLRCFLAEKAQEYLASTSKNKK